MTVGHATAIGEDAYNQELSDERAGCASLHARTLGRPGEYLEFREVAKGETMMPEDLPGSSPNSRRQAQQICDRLPEASRQDFEADFRVARALNGLPPA